MLKWSLEFKKGALKDLKKLDILIRKRIFYYLENRVLCATDPKSLGGPLMGPLAGLWRYRVGDYRIICEIQHKRLVVLVVEVNHRKEVYQI